MEELIRNMLDLETRVRDLETREFSTGSLVVYIQTADKTIANTVTETTLFNTTGAGGYGLVLPANFFSVGRQLTFWVGGHYSTTSPAGTLRIKITLTKAGPTVYTILDTTANTMTNSITTRFWGIKASITGRTTGATGTVMGAGFVKYMTSHVLGFDDDFAPNTTAVTVDTTAALTIGMTATWGTANAGNTITAQEMSIMAYK